MRGWGEVQWCDARTCDQLFKVGCRRGLADSALRVDQDGYTYWVVPGGLGLAQSWQWPTATHPHLFLLLEQLPPASSFGCHDQNLE